MKSQLKEGLRHILPRSIDQRRILGGPLRGMTLVTSWHDYPAAILGRTERALLEWFRRNARPGETWLDIGAHYGYTAIALCGLVGPEGRVYAFEPLPASAGHVNETRRLNSLRQLSVIPMGLGLTTSLEVRRLSTVRGMIDSTLPSADWEENVVVARFDWLWPLISGRDLTFHGIKIDVQGMELEVLQGMRGSLRSFQPRVALEFHKGVDRQAILCTLAECGYGMPGTPIEPVAGEATPRYLDNRSYAFEAS